MTVPHLVAIYRDLFGHDEFNGRATRFFKYEGLGCIYWHMVSKLMLAVQRAFWHASDTGASEPITTALANHYYFIRKGLSYDWDPARFGAFPVDPHSHSAADTRAQQPGLTGRVKEDLLARWGELGIRVKEGGVSFNPALLRKTEFVKHTTNYRGHSPSGKEYSVTLTPGMLGFTYCQVPVLYRLANKPLLILTTSTAQKITRQKLALTQSESASLFDRSGKLRLIEVELQPRPSIMIHSLRRKYGPGGLFILVFDCSSNLDREPAGPMNACVREVHCR